MKLFSVVRICLELKIGWLGNPQNAKVIQRVYIMSKYFTNGPKFRIMPNDPDAELYRAEKETLHFQDAKEKHAKKNVGNENDRDSKIFEKEMELCKLRPEGQIDLKGLSLIPQGGKLYIKYVWLSTLTLCHFLLILSSWFWKIPVHMKLN